MRTIERPRRYVSRYLLIAVRPLFRYSAARDAYVLRAVGRRRGPVLRLDRRRTRRFDGVDRRRPSAA